MVAVSEVQVGDNENDQSIATIDRLFVPTKIVSPDWREQIPRFVLDRINSLMVRNELMSFVGGRKVDGYSPFARIPVERRYDEIKPVLEFVADQFPHAIIAPMLAIDGVEMYMVGSLVPLYLNRNKHERMRIIRLKNGKGMSDLDFLVTGGKVSSSELVRILYNTEFKDRYAKLNADNIRNSARSDHYPKPPIFVPVGFKIRGKRKTPAYVCAIYPDSADRVLTMKVYVYTNIVNYTNMTHVAEFSFSDEADNIGITPLHYDLRRSTRLSILQLSINGNVTLFTLREGIRNIKLSRLGIKPKDQAIMWIRGVLDLLPEETKNRMWQPRQFKKALMILETRPDSLSMADMDMHQWTEHYYPKFARAIIRNPSYVMYSIQLQSAMPLLSIFLGNYTADVISGILDLRSSLTGTSDLVLVKILANVLNKKDVFALIGKGKEKKRPIPNYRYAVLAKYLLSYSYNVQAAKATSEEDILALIHEIVTEAYIANLDKGKIGNTDIFKSRLSPLAILH